jgi:hypothetical protein
LFATASATLGERVRRDRVEHGAGDGVDAELAGRKVLFEVFCAGGAGD